MLFVFDNFFPTFNPKNHLTLLDATTKHEKAGNAISGLRELEKCHFIEHHFLVDALSYLIICLMPLGIQKFPIIFSFCSIFSENDHCVRGGVRAGRSFSSYIHYGAWFVFHSNDSCFVRIDDTSPSLAWATINLIQIGRKQNSRRATLSADPVTVTLSFEK